MEIFDVVSNLFHYAISFVVIISFIVFIHEFGHFYVARLCGVRIDEFSIGFGKELWGRNDKKGTRWKICLIPMGGFVKMHGDASEASTPDRSKLEHMSEEEKRISFHFKPLWQKFLIVLAGPVANFILATFIFASVYMTYGKLELDAPPLVDEVIEKTPAAKIGLKPGDLIIKLDGKEVKKFTDLQQIVQYSPLQEMVIEYKRGDKIITDKIAPEFTEVDDGHGNKAKIGMLGIKRAAVEVTDEDYKRLSFGEAVPAAVGEVYRQCQIMLKGVGQIISGVRSTKELGGPVKIMEYSGQSTNKITEAVACMFKSDGKDCGNLVRDGLVISLYFMAMISTMLGLVNLFPIPMLDGGHLMFYLVEAIARRPVGEKYQEFAFRVGFAFLIGLTLYVTFNDIMSVFDRYVKS
jgi:regulator of sigma E protease